MTETSNIIQSYKRSFIYFSLLETSMRNICFKVFIFSFLTCSIKASNAESSFVCTSSSQQHSYETRKRSIIPNRGANAIGEIVTASRANSDSINILRNIVSDIRGNTDSTEAVLNDVLLFVEELIEYHNRSSDSPLPKSCLDIKTRMPLSPSGVYLIGANENDVQYVYCYMETLCDSDGGWTRLAFLNMTDTLENCPDELRLYEVNGIRACGRPVSGSGGCQSVIYPSYGVKYSRVCGRVRGYQFYSPDAVDSTIGLGHSDINAQYVDGVSLTRGNPRKHIWTFMAGLKEDNSYNSGSYTCPCQDGSQQSTNIPSFVDDYFCESGNQALPTGLAAVLYTEDPLWDGEYCRDLESPCCNKPNLPWFNKPLGTTTDDFVEVRICSDQDSGNEDAPIEQLEVYVK